MLGCGAPPPIPMPMGGFFGCCDGGVEADDIGGDGNVPCGE